jgi:outer membrane immunogenic protein
VLLAGVANAADLPFKAMPVKAPPPVSYDWTGFYVGGYYADAIGNQKGATPTTTTDSHSGETNVNQRGVALGLTAGYNWQFDPHWLVGVEGDLGWLGLDRTNTEFNDNTLVGLKTDWYATARARAGYVTGPSLLYLTAGGAFVHVRDEFGGDLTTQGSTLVSTTRTSWTAGGGIETRCLATGRPRPNISSSTAATLSISTPTRTDPRATGAGFPRRSTRTSMSSRPA